MDREAELRALIAEQEKDAAWGHRAYQRGLSLDYEFEGGGTFSEVVGYDVAPGDTGVRKIPRPQKWTRGAIIKHIQAWVKEHGETPLSADWNKPNGRGIPSTASLSRHFGSFDDAIRAAGFEPRGVGKSTPANPSGRRVRPQKRNARLTSADLAAAYVLYDRRRLSLRELSELLWDRYGYPNPLACRHALAKGFKAEGFPTRSKSEARMALAPEHRRAIAHKARAARRHFQRGEEKPNAVLTETAVVSIRASSETTAALARAYDVSEGTIRAVRRRQTWRHVP